MEHITAIELVSLFNIHKLGTMRIYSVYKITQSAELSRMKNCSCEDIHLKSIEHQVTIMSQQENNQLTTKFGLKCSKIYNLSMLISYKYYFL